VLQLTPKWARGESPLGPTGRDANHRAPGGLDMDRTSLTEILDEAQALLGRTYNRNELRQLLLSKMDVDLDGIAPNATGNKDLVFEVLTWMDRHGTVFDLIRCAAIGRPKVPDWQALLGRITNEPQKRPAPAPRAPDSRPSPAWTGPPDVVTALIRGYLRIRRVLPDGDQKTVQLQGLVNQLLALPLEEYDLVEEFHLSNCGGERLVAILTLVRQPNQQFLRWLSERLGVEGHFVGYQAAVALLAASRTLPQIDLDDVADAIEFARDFLRTDWNGGRSRVLAEALQEITRR
jgi:hypothetical protein